MTLENFIIATKILENYYGKDLNASQRQMWFDKLKNYNVDRYSSAIDFLCGSSRYMPLLNDVMEAVRNQRSEQQEQVRFNCNICHGTGYIVYQKMINNLPHDYACLCVCQNAVGKEYHSKDGYYLKTAQEVFGDKIPKYEQKIVSEKKDAKQLVNNLVEQMCF